MLAHFITVDQLRQKSVILIFMAVLLSEALAEAQYWSTVFVSITALEYLWGSEEEFELSPQITTE